VVFRIGRGWSSILTRTLISRTATAWVTRDPEIDPIGPPPNASGAVPADEENVPFSNSLQIRPGQVFNLSDLGLLVVYDARFKDSKIYGFIGGYERPNPPSTVLNHSRTAESCFNCPRCEAPVVAGQLICFSCSTIYLFEGRDRLYSPMLREFVEVVPPKNRPPIRISVSKIARAIEHGGQTSQRSIRSVISRLLEECICYQARWLSDAVMCW
jgi:hypothetical protein